MVVGSRQRGMASFTILAVAELQQGGVRCSCFSTHTTYLSHPRFSDLTADDESPQYVLSDAALRLLAACQPTSRRELLRAVQSVVSRLNDSRPLRALSTPFAVSSAVRRDARHLCSLLAEIQASYGQEGVAPAETGVAATLLPTGVPAGAKPTAGAPRKAQRGSEAERAERRQAMINKFSAKSEVWCLNYEILVSRSQRQPGTQYSTT